MKTMKKFWKYFINFIVLMLLVYGLTYWGMANYNKEEKTPIECITQTQSPVIQVTETTNKKIIGTVTNDTGILINVIYVKAEFYNEAGTLIGTKYDKIKYFNVGEKAKFTIEYGYTNITTVKLTTTDTMV